MPLISCDISFILNWSENPFSVIGTAGKHVTKFAITYTQLYVRVTVMNINIRYSEYYKENHYLNYFIDLRFQGINKTFVSSYQNIRKRTSFLPTVKIKH